MSSDGPEQAPQNAIAAAFPAPPPFWQNFTSENIERFEKIRDETPEPQRRDSEESRQDGDDARMGEDDPATRDGADDKEKERRDLERLRLLDLPVELRYLIPPRIPEDGRYRSFGEDFDLNHPQTILTTRNIPQLYPSTSTTSTSIAASASTTATGTTPPSPQPPKFSTHPSHLTTLTRSILLNFLELAGLMSQDPTQHPEKLQDINTLLHNAHSVVNEYRPHQARETLIEVMEGRVRERREEVRRVRGLVGKVGALVDGGDEDKKVGEGPNVAGRDGMEVDGKGVENGVDREEGDMVVGSKEVDGLLKSEEERWAEKLERKKTEQDRRVWGALGNL
ncbi:MAG: Mediator of RNA polymerase II transcription subunit 7 [Alyxoria varia]|nr:MAG: Mediator of RNA polymerase II transcription subunit 7 [Alyxoria varia]